MNLVSPTLRAAGLMAVLWISCIAVLPAGVHYFNGKDFRGGYCLLPDSAPRETLWVCVDVHGAGGLKNDKRGHELKALLEPAPVIVIVPSFTDGYQSGSGAWAKQLIEHFKWVQKQHKVHPRMFIHGHSGGAQFAHRFTFAHPELVLGVSAHSAGSWASGDGAGSVNASARKVPFAISCGMEDKARSIPGAPFNRIEWYQRFEDQLKKKGFVFTGAKWPATGHAVPMDKMASMIRECFLLSAYGKVPGDGDWQGNVKALASAAARQSGSRL